MAVTDPAFGFRKDDITGPANTFFAITPHDSTDMVLTRGIYVGVGGNVTAVNADNTAVEFVGVPAGATLAIRARRVNSTGTTATSLVGLV